MVDENFFIRPGMKYIEICEENEFYKTIDGIVYTKDGKTLLKCPRNHPGKVAVPDGVEMIAESALKIPQLRILFSRIHCGKLKEGRFLTALS